MTSMRSRPSSQSVACRLRHGLGAEDFRYLCCIRHNGPFVNVVLVTLWISNDTSRLCSWLTDHGNVNCMHNGYFRTVNPGCHSYLCSLRTHVCFVVSTLYVCSFPSSSY